MKHVLHYLKGMPEHLLVIGEAGALPWNGQTHTSLQGYCDTNWALQEHQHSMLGYVFMIDGGAVSWSSKKQPVIALLTTEAEYIMTTHAAKEALWLRTFIAEITRPLTCPIILYCNNQLAISVSKNDQFHTRTKHIDDVTENGLLTAHYFPIAENAANAFMKALPGPKVIHFVSLMSLHVA